MNVGQAVVNSGAGILYSTGDCKHLIPSPPSSFNSNSLDKIEYDKKMAKYTECVNSNNKLFLSSNSNSLIGISKQVKPTTKVLVNNVNQNQTEPILPVNNINNNGSLIQLNEETFLSKNKTTLIILGCVLAVSIGYFFMRKK